MPVCDALALESVTKRFGRFTAVDDLSLRLPAGEVLGFLGPNGAGKTTTLRMVMSIIYPDSGRISVLGYPQALQVKDRIGYLPEERGLYRKMTVQETLRYFGQLKGLHGQRLRARIDDCLERVGLGDWRQKRVEALSKGMSQKLQFVTAILHEPELVILDEPFAGLDPLNVDLLEQLIAERRQAGATVIFSTHQMNQAERLCDRIVLIDRGRKIIDGPVNEVRGRFAARVVVIEVSGDLTPLVRRGGLPGVVAANLAGGRARLELDAQADPNVILAAAMQVGQVLKFELQRPDLQEIFIKLVGRGRPAGQPAAGIAPGAEQAHE